MTMPLSDSINEFGMLPKIEGVRMGQVVDIDENGNILVEYPGNYLGPVPARFTRSADIESLKLAKKNSSKILLAFENNNPRLPVIIDILSSLIDNISDSDNLKKPLDFALDVEEPKDVTIDGKRVVFDAKEEIVLKCGKSSITLTKAGKVIIRGAYLLNRSSGVNRIKGGSVQIN
ncbi:MAG: DUF2345 domain-containing protein [Desulfobacula sp.]|nr:DUF2345 domain-containing protein [Desulfobacula sp.]